ncbi:MAG: outer membrane lipoprotein-sorting protein [Candidatus Latescibacterota bacterium]
MEIILDSGGALCYYFMEEADIPAIPVFEVMQIDAKEVGMNRNYFGIVRMLVIAFSLGAGFSRTGPAQEMSAEELIRRIETQYQGETSHGISRMRVATERWTREMTLEMWSKGRDRFLVRVLAPKKDEGVASLKIGEEMWNFLPNIDRLVKIPSSMMGENWMGSHLTNDDLVKEDQVDKLYTLSMTRKEKIAEITGIPKPRAAVVWGKIVYTVEMDRLIPLSTQYFDESGALVRTISFDQVQQTSGRWIPMRMRVQPKDQPKEQTLFEYQKLDFNVRLPDDFFSLRSLRKR